MWTSIFPHQGPEYTGAWMHQVTRDFSSDLGRLAGLPFPEFFDFVKNLPYMANEELFDDPFSEYVPRPAYLLDPAMFPAIDCKGKAILVGAWCTENGVPFKYIAAKEDPAEEDIHHVFPVISADGGQTWINADATFSNFEIGAPKPTLSKAKELIPCLDAL